MAVRALIGRGLRAGRPLAIAVGLSVHNAEAEVAVSVIDAGERDLAEAVAEAVGAPLRAPVPDDLVICALAPDGDLSQVLPRLAEHRRRGGEVLVVVTGGAVARRRAIRRLAAEPCLGVACMEPIEALDAQGMEMLRRAVVRRLRRLGRLQGGVPVDAVVPAARRSPGLRATASDLMTVRASRRAAVVAALPSSRAAMPVLSSLQVRLASDVAALGGGRPHAAQAATLAAVAVAAPLWRQIARTAQSAAPGIAPATRAGIAYGVTRGIGLVAARTRSTATTSSEEDS